MSDPANKIILIPLVVQKTEDGKYVIINNDGRSIPLKVAGGSKDVAETKKYIVKCKLALSNMNPIRN
jgi:hypothetical protein